MRLSRVSINRLLLLLLSAAPAVCTALEPEPRKWSHLPLDTGFAGVAYAWTEADIFFDPALSLEDVKMEKSTLGGRYIRSFGLLGHTARVEFTQAWQKSKWRGLLDGVPASTSRSGLSDSFVRLAVNLLGAPPLRGREYFTYRAGVKNETLVGTGLVLRLPTGQYKKHRLLNLGQNRYVLRPQLGIVHTRGKWSGEFTGEVALHGKNRSFFNGNTLEQKPLYIAYAHLIYTFAPGRWASLGAGYDYGGENRINGVDKGDRKQDIAWAFSYGHALSRQARLKLSYIGTRTQESTGFDSDTLLLSTAFTW